MRVDASSPNCFANFAAAGFSFGKTGGCLAGLKRFDFKGADSVLLA